MSKIVQCSRISHHTIFGATGSTFSVPTSEDFTDGSWTVLDLALSEIGINEDDGKAYIRIGNGINEIMLSGGSSGGWPAVLSTDNTSGGNNAVMTTGDVITSDVATTNEINMNYGFSNGLLISNDNGTYGKGVLYMEDGFFGGVTEVSNYNGRVYSYSTSETLIENLNNGLYLTDASVYLERNAGGVDRNVLQFSNTLGFSSADLTSYGSASRIRLIVGGNRPGLTIKDNEFSSVTSDAINSRAVFIGTNNSIIGTSSVNSVITGGSSGEVQSDNSIIVGGNSNLISLGGDNSIIAGAESSIITGNLAGIIASGDVTITGQYSAAIASNNFTGTYAKTLYNMDQYSVANSTTTTTNNTVTTAKSFTPDVNGLFNVTIELSGFEVATGNAYTAKLYSGFKVIAGTVTQIDTTTVDEKSDFTTATSTIDTDGTFIRCRVTGETARTINWRVVTKISR